MTDIFSQEKRSEIMSKVKSRNTKPEIWVRTFLFSLGCRFRKNDKRYVGTPDLVLPKYKTIIFIHGCFWHGHDCKKGSLPADNADFWREKIAKNKIRDKKNQEILINSGFHVIVIWECELKNKVLREQRLTRLVEEIKK